MLKGGVTRVMIDITISTYLIQCRVMVPENIIENTTLPLDIKTL